MFKIIKLRKAKYPICPECGKHTIVLFTPPKLEHGSPIFSNLGKDEYVDWDRTHLYCCNANKNCQFNTRIKDLTTPLTEKP